MRPLLLSMLLLATASLGEAQVRPVAVDVPSKTLAPVSAGSVSVPVSMLPPAGRCRIWIDGVPPQQQPAPTDCATALRQKPANGTILYGPSERDEAGERFEARSRAHRAKERTAPSVPPTVPPAVPPAVAPAVAPAPAARPTRAETRRPAAPDERKPREDRS